MEAHVREVEQWAQMRSDERERFCERLALAVGQPVSVIADDLASGRFMGADDASVYGLIDEICRPDAEIRKLPGPPIGFRPRR
jgi:ATP-dependent protease ClpP protease subunit